MTIEQLIESVFEQANRIGFEAYEVYFEDSKSLELQGFEGDIIKYADSTKRGVNFRGIYHGKLGSAYSEVIDEESAILLVKKALEVAMLIEVEDEVFLFEGSSTYPELKLFEPALQEVTQTAKMDLVLDLEKRALATGQVSKVSGTYYGDGQAYCRIVNSKGLDVSYQSNQAYAYMGVIGTHQGETYSEYEFAIGRDFNKIAAAPIAELAVEKVVAKFGGKPVPTGEYSVVIENSAAGSLLSAYMSIFSADVAQKGLSLLKGKLGQKIASENVNLLDNPHLEDGLASVPFDGEGVPTFKKKLIQNGEMMTFLHNLKTANKDGVQSTGNASRGSYQSVIGVSHTNAYIEPGAHSLEALIQGMDHGLVITGFDGLHAGTNAISGDFSLGARGFLVENGQKVRPVQQIVVSGNFLDLLKNIQAVGSDLKFETEPVGSPSLLVRGLSVAGD